MGDEPEALPDQYGYILDGIPHMLRFKRGPISQCDAIVNSTMPVYTASQLQAYGDARAKAARMEWVSVEDAVPKIGQEVLVFGKSPWASAPSVKVDMWDEIHESPVSFSSATICVGEGWTENADSDITHWMPLPPPPTMEAERAERNRAMWKGQCERQALQLEALRMTDSRRKDLLTAALYITAREDDTAVLSSTDAERIAELLLDMSGVDLEAASSALGGEGGVMEKLTKADTVALWHAIDDMKFMHIGMKSDPPLPQEILDAHTAKITAAKRALRKVNAIRKQQSATTGGKGAA